MIGLGGTVFSLIFIILFERSTLIAIPWDGVSVALLAGYVICLFAMYVITAVSARWGCHADLHGEERRCGVQHAFADFGRHRFRAYVLPLR